jgi:hypothetical protein
VVSSPPASLAPNRLVVDSQDRFLIADRENGRLQRCQYTGGVEGGGSGV